MNSLFSWFSDVLREEYELLRVLKENERSQVWLIRHKVSGGRFVLCRFTGNAEVYRRLLGYVFPDLPRTLEVAVRGEENLVLEEYVEGDTLDFLLRGPCFPGTRPGRSWRSCARPPGPCRKGLLFVPAVPRASTGGSGRRRPDPFPGGSSMPSLRC